MASAPSYKAIHAIADRLEPKLRRAFMAAVLKLQDRMSLAAIARSIERGEVTIEITGALQAWPRDLQAAVRVVNQAFAEATRVAARQLPTVAARSSFTLVNQQAVRAAELRSAQLVREVTDETRRAIRSSIAKAISTGLPPREAARLIKPVIGLTERQAGAVLRQRALLAKQGASSAHITKVSDRYAAQLLRRRAVLIARTETIRASTDGQLELWRQARAAGFLGPDTMKRWTVTPDDRLCPQCSGLNGKVVGLDELFPGSIQGPPAHPACRCAVVTVSAKVRGRRAA
jgi:SPP1 gp7 family putative phage head morphogenesis protein